MTEPTGGAPVPPPQDPGSWQAPPPPASQPQFQQAPVAAGPAPGIVYADTVTRVIALVVDAIILAILLAVVNTVLLVIGGWGAFLITGVLYVAANAVYFIYTWTRQRASYGQKFLSLETVNAADGATLTQDQAIRRWMYLWGPASVAQILAYSGGVVLGLIGALVALLAFFYELYLLYTVTQNPKRQGFHDVQAGTVVVKRVG